MSVKRVQTKDAPAAIGPYSQGIVAGGFLYTAGQIALDPATGEMSDGDVVTQTKRVLKNLEAILQASNATWSDVVKTTVYLRDLSDFPRVNEAYASVLGSASPARSTVQVEGLPRGGLIEIDAVVWLGERRA